MYLPGHFEQKDVGALHALIDAAPLGAWVVQGQEGLLANHIPFLLKRDRGSLGTLVAHVARANTVWKELSQKRPSLVIFQGPGAYITPGWYPSKAEHGKVVPTWSYAVVHVHGTAVVHDDREWLHAHVGELTQVHEAREAKPWSVADAPADFIENMLRAIVGIEIPIDRIEGKWKVGQNRTEPDQHGAEAGLRARPDADSKAVADLMRQNLRSKDVP